MQNAPARQPRVGPAVPQTRRGWLTPAFLTAAILLAGAVMLPPFAAGTLFPSRNVGSSAGTSRAIAPVETLAAQPEAQIAAAVPSAGTTDGNVETTYSELPLAPEPANEPPRSPGSDMTRPSGTLATGIFAARIAPEAEAAAEPSTELAVPTIPPLVAAAPASAEPGPAISPPPARRQPLPLQTDLLPPPSPRQPSGGKSGADRHG
jgi:hypothetical protein